MKIKISDMMDYIKEDSVDIQEKEIASANRIKEATLKKIQNAEIMGEVMQMEPNVINHRVRNYSKAGTTAAVVIAASIMLAGTAVAHLDWTGFAFSSELSESERYALLKENETCSAVTDQDGNVRYYDAGGQEIMVLTAEEAAEYQKKLRAEKEQTLQASTKLLDIYTLPFIPSGITEITTDEEGQLEDFVLGSGFMLLLRPEGVSRYSLKKGDIVTIALNVEEECILEIGLVKDGAVTQTDSYRAKNHIYSFQIEEDGEYNYYIMYYSANKGLFTDCRVVVE